MCNSDAPDMSGANAAAVMQANLSKEQLDWMKQLYAESAPDRKASIDRANLVSDKQLQALDQQSELTKDYADYQANTFRPLEKTIIDDANTYNTQAKQDAEVGRSVADVHQSFSMAQSAQDRSLGRRGVVPGSGADLEARNQLTVQGALADISARKAARDKVETVGRAMKMDAANLGRNLASNQATSAGIALNQGNSAVQNAQVAGNVTAQGAQMMNSGYAAAQNGLAGAGNTYTNIARINQQAGDNSGAWGAFGTVAGQLAGSKGVSALIMSDVNMKEDINKIDPDRALESVEKTPVSEWQYKEGNQASDGGQRHVGPMAQDVQKTMGNKAAPNGKKIDVVSMNGITMAAIQSLSKKVDAVAARQGIRV